METTKDYTIIAQLETDLLKINEDGSGYDTQISQVIVGDYLWEDMKVKPSIAIYAPITIVEKPLLGHTYIKSITISLDLFMDNQQGQDIYQDIYKFKDDIESFIFKSTDWTYQPDSVLVEPSMVYIHDAIKQANIVFLVRYND